MGGDTLDPEVVAVFSGLEDMGFDSKCKNKDLIRRKAGQRAMTQALC
jgi:hypothetical protein